MVAPTIEEAVAAADRIGYPVVVKLYSHTITHKTDVGGVQLNLKDAAAVRNAYELIRASVTEKKGAEHFEGVTVQPMVNWTGYELILGSSIDPQFGPVLLFGMGGQLVELFKDRALGLPPLTTTLARRMMENTRIYGALKGIRGRRGVDLDQLEQLLVRFSQLVVEQRWIAELDINPLLASPERLIALDARVVLHDPATDVKDLPRLAIRPYPPEVRRDMDLPGRPGAQHAADPARRTSRWSSTSIARCRPRRSSSATSSTSASTSGPPIERLIRICFLDYDRELALVAECPDPETGARQIIGIGRLSRVFGTDDASFAVPGDRRAPGQGGRDASCSGAWWTSPGPRGSRRSPPTCAPRTSACDGRPRRSASRSFRVPQRT